MTDTKQNEITPALGLDGNFCKLAPLADTYIDDLTAVAIAGDLWRTPYMWIPAPQEVPLYVTRALMAKSVGLEQPFVILAKGSSPYVQKVVGCTRFQAIHSHNQRLQIGSTWIAKSWQGSVINSESKYLMLEHAFERLGMLRVEFTTDPANLQSRAALRGIGAREEGILRNYVVIRGSSRDYLMCSITIAEWPEIKLNVAKRIRKINMAKQFNESN